MSSLSMKSVIAFPSLERLEEINRCATPPGSPTSAKFSVPSAKDSVFSAKSRNYKRLGTYFDPAACADLVAAIGAELDMNEGLRRRNRGPKPLTIRTEFTPTKAQRYAQQYREFGRIEDDEDSEGVASDADTTLVERAGRCGGCKNQLGSPTDILSDMEDWWPLSIESVLLAEPETAGSECSDEPCSPLTPREVSMMHDAACVEIIKQKSKEADAYFASESLSPMDRVGCPIEECLDELVGVHALKMHLAVHEIADEVDRMPFDCSGCDVRFASVPALNYHICPNEPEVPMSPIIVLDRHSRPIVVMGDEQDIIQVMYLCVQSFDTGMGLPSAGPTYVLSASSGIASLSLTLLVPSREYSDATCNTVTTNREVPVPGQLEARLRCHESNSGEDPVDLWSRDEERGMVDVWWTSLDCQREMKTLITWVELETFFCVRFPEPSGLADTFGLDFFFSHFTIIRKGQQLSSLWDEGCWLDAKISALKNVSPPVDLDCETGSPFFVDYDRK
ncbi:hypothetical protein CYLTODRAFT_414332 [Cylindrobasidium torrendii FP15055 ss-10]|uniref:C2H2-type domain-containing protein n=1 Tax=Cylindrobasidium torrendii FP15055 ss-10 TaxID=1314674 RepID=A0A0D7AYP7_9AGAR|nr:hypothetical protein CYLTODRAFT_414332 [Cylindrobasidium torrendii FP15055 ss-10]